MESPATAQRHEGADKIPVAMARPAVEPESSGDARVADQAQPTLVLEPRATRFPEPARLVAFGDVHGDLDATRRALRLAGAIDASDHWIGGSLVVVQTGDQLDRGDGEQEILDLFERVRAEAESKGGAVHVLNGNHELMNAAGDMRYVTPGGFSDFEDVDGLVLDSAELRSLPEHTRARTAAFAPGGPYARVLARRNTAVVVGASVFVHGGVLPQHVSGGLADLERLNQLVRAWLSGQGELAALEPDVLGTEGLVWTRVYARDDAEACALLGDALTRLDAKRMVVGHTVQEKGITSGCDDRVWRIDVGMAAHYGGQVQVLEIVGDRVQTLGP